MFSDLAHISSWERQCKGQMSGYRDFPTLHCISGSTWYCTFQILPAFHRGSDGAGGKCQDIGNFRLYVASLTLRGILPLYGASLTLRGISAHVITLYLRVISDSTWQIWLYVTPSQHGWFYEASGGCYIWSYVRGEWYAPVNIPHLAAASSATFCH
jgi:hypothetical protein